MALNGDLKPPFTLEQLVFLFRQRVDDLPGDVVAGTTPWTNDDDGLLWKNEEICGYADEAQQELAHRKPIIDTDQNISLTHLAVSGTNQQVVIYDPRILKIERAKFVETVTGDEHVLEKRSLSWMDARTKDWDLEGGVADQGAPCFYIEYAEEYRLRLWPVPDIAGTIHLTVHRLPMERLSWTLRRSLIEAQTAHQLDLLDWMMHRAYMKRDAETENPELSAAHKAAFDERIGLRPSAHLQAVRRREHKLQRRVQGHFV